MGVIASPITSLTIVNSAVYSGADQRKHQSSASQMASNAENVSIWSRHHAEGGLDLLTSISVPIMIQRRIEA